MAHMPDARRAIVHAAIDLTVTDGWSGITMAKVAQAAGFSRQTVYNEVGGKPQLAEAMVEYELTGFLTRVEEAFAHEPDPVDALRLAARSVLSYGEHHPLLGVIVAGGADDLLALLTVNAHAIHLLAHQAIGHHLENTPLANDTRLIDLIVRVVLSYLTLPAPSLADAHARVDALICAIASNPAVYPAR
jgi:AcrR family transcriptional regulator